MSKFKRLTAMVAAGAVGLAVAGCAGTMQDDKGPTVISYDHGALDTLNALGLSDKVVAIPQQSLPNYLAHLVDNGVIDAGGLKTPDLAVIKELKPDLVLLTGRQGESVEEVQAITEVRDVTLAEGNYKIALTAKVRDLAALYDQQDKADDQLADLWQHVDDSRQKLADKGPVVVVTHNLGNFSLRGEPVVFELLGLTQPTVPEGVESITRGTRVFTPMTPETLATMAPDVLFVVDRSAAIGDEPLDAAQLKAAFATVGGGEIRVKVLSPGLWYLSGAGLESTRLQVEEVVDALQYTVGPRPGQQAFYESLPQQDPEGATAEL